MTRVITAPRPGARLARVAALLVVLLPFLARAQAPGWAGAMPGSLTQVSGNSYARAVAADASGNVYVTGYFTGSVAFGSTLLTSAGGNDLFVAKYVPATDTWAWAQSGGGTGDDRGSGVAVSGTSVYVTGYFYNTTTNNKGVLFGGTGPATGTVQVNGASTTSSNDLLLAEYTDQGTSALLGWTQVGGGTGDDRGNGVAVSGTSVYVAGTIQNTTLNYGGVLFGGTGTTAGTVQVNGASTGYNNDLLLAKYTDQGTSAALGWTQVGGGNGNDYGQGVAVNGSSVYVGGYLTNSTSNSNTVVFGGGGTTAGAVQVNGASGASSFDLLLTKYTDNGSTGTFGWSQVGGGTASDFGQGVAVSGSSVYLVGYFSNNTSNANAVLFGGRGTTRGTVQVNGATATVSPDLVLAKYTDQGTSATLGWTQVGGGTDTDQGMGVAASGSSVYVTGYFTNSTGNLNGVLFGGGGTTAGTVAVKGVSTSFSFDLVLAKYTDQGTSATLGWTQVGGGTGSDYGYGVAVSGTSVYAASQVNSGSSVFGTAAGSPLPGTTGNRTVLAQATDAGSSGSWGAVAAATNGGTSTTQAVATDASGNVFVTGSFTGQVDFGSTRLSSVGGSDLFVAKYVPGTSTWAWAQSGGGSSSDQGTGVAVSGSSVYVSGYVYNNVSNSQGVLFGGTGTAAGTVPVNGASSSLTNDLLLVKYTDQGTSALLGWTQVGGGTGDDQGLGVAVNGSSVYVAGYLTNTTTNTAKVLLGGGGTTAGTVRVNGASSSLTNDLLLAKYTDQGTSAALGWTQVGGGNGNDYGQGVAVSGTSVYVAGYLTNNTANGNGVLFGGGGTTAGTVPVSGASTTSSNDVLLVKYTDQGPTATLGWTQVGGGTSDDRGNGVAVSGGSVYVAGSLTNSTSNYYGVLFGGTGTTAGTVQVNGATSLASLDLLLAKYTDQGTSALLGWTQVGGGTDTDQGLGVAASGSGVYVAGYLTNNTANANGVLFGATGTTPGTVQVNGASGTTSNDLLLTRYTDNSTSATLNWAQVGGGTSTDYGYGIALSGQNVLAVGYVTPSASFGSYPIATPAAASTNVLARAVDTTPLPVQLVAFAATAAGPAVRLAWTTASEINSARFEVQRSADGRLWQELGRVAAAGSSAGTRAYTYLDGAAPAGLSYYRLRQVDTDGTSAYSPVRTVTLGGAGLALYPNPAPGGAATLTGAAPGAAVRVLDALGRVAATATVAADGTAALGELVPGLYVVRVGAGRVRLAVE